MQRTGPMNTATYRPSTPKRKLIGLLGIVVLHLLLFWGLQAGLSRTVVTHMPAVVQALLLQDKRPEPPPLPPPPAAVKPPTPTPTPPPLPVPAPPKPLPAVPTAAAPIDTAVTSAAPNAIAAVAPTSQATAPPAPAPAPPAPPAPRAVAPARTAVGVNMAQCDKPEYPSASRRMEEEGTVALRFLVGADGKVLQTEIEKSSGYKRLDDAARTGLSKCLFRPATVDGKPEQAWTTLRYVWRLE